MKINCIFNFLLCGKFQTQKQREQYNEPLPKYTQCNYILREKNCW